jgi:hypothetical protein
MVESTDFKIHFFVTKEKSICDISIDPVGLPEKVKQIIFKGLVNLTNWNPAIVNGPITDDEYLLRKEVL